MTRAKILTVLTGLAAIAAIVATIALAGGPGMMGGSSGGMMGGSGGGMMGGAFGGIGAGGAGAAGTATPSTAQLTTIRNRIDGWLGQVGYSGFKVAEVMAFTNTDYVAVHNRSGKPAFELLTNLSASWVMEEPPSMMWNTRYGAMDGLGTRVGPMTGGWMTGGNWNSWSGSGSGKIATTAQAVAAADRWLAEASPDERVASDTGGSAMGKFPGYYTFDTTRDGKIAGMLSVNVTTGAVWYHAWHGRFLAEHEF
jgi:hypothetical protein